MRFLVIPALVATLMVAVPARADFSTGWMSYEKADFFGAARAWLPLAEEGDARAQYALAILLLRGRGFDRSASAAAVLLSPAAAAGHPEAAYALALLYQDGDGVRTDRTEAARLYRVAAEAGYAPAQNNLALMHAIADGLPRDALSAHVWFSIAARNGEENAGRNRDRVAAELTPAQAVESARRLQAWTQPEAPMLRRNPASTYPGAGSLLKALETALDRQALRAAPAFDDRVEATVPEPAKVAAGPIEVAAPVVTAPAPPVLAGPPLRLLPR